MIYTLKFERNETMEINGFYNRHLDIIWTSELLQKPQANRSRTADIQTACCLRLETARADALA